MRRIWSLLLCVAIGVALAIAADTANSLFEKALVKERADADLRGAVKLYERIARDYSRDRKVAAQALIRMGQCYERLGNADAKKAYEQVLTRFADQPEAAAQARARLAALGQNGETNRPSMRAITAKNIDAPSPDGRYLLQFLEEGLSVIDLRTNQSRHVVEGTVGFAKFSNDGKQIAFIRPLGNRNEIWVVGADGSGERLILKPGTGLGTPLGWFAQDQKIAVLEMRQDGPCRIVSVPVEGGPPSALFESPCDDLWRADISPGGGLIVHTKHVKTDPPQDELRLISTEDGNESLLYQAQSRAESPLWTPDGKMIVFLSDRRMPGVTLDLWVLRVADGKPQGPPELVRKDMGSIVGNVSKVYAFGPITNDGTYYFRRWEVGVMRQLLTTNFDPDTGKVVSSPSFVSPVGGTSSSPSFSRDGRWLCYLRVASDLAAHLVLRSVESGEEKTFPFTPPRNVGAMALGWTQMFPDGRSALVLAHRPPDGDGYYRLDFDSGAWTLLKKSNPGWASIFQSSISPDGGTLYVAARSPNDKVWRLLAHTVANGQEREIRSVPGPLANFSLSYDGNLLAMGRLDGKDAVIEIQPTAGGSAREVYREQGVADPSRALAWEPDGRHLIFNSNTRPPECSNGYLRLSIEDGRAQCIGISAQQGGPVQFPTNFGALAIHPGGRQLVYTARSDIGGAELWVLENFLPGLKRSAK